MPSPFSETISIFKISQGAEEHPVAADLPVRALTVLPG